MENEFDFLWNGTEQEEFVEPNPVSFLGEADKEEFIDAVAFPTAEQMRELTYTNSPYSFKSHDLTILLDIFHMCAEKGEKFVEIYGWDHPLGVEVEYPVLDHKYPPAHKRMIIRPATIFYLRKLGYKVDVTREKTDRGFSSIGIRIDFFKELLD